MELTETGLQLSGVEMLEVWNVVLQGSQALTHEENRMFNDRVWKGNVNDGMEIDLEDFSMLYRAGRMVVKKTQDGANFVSPMEDDADIKIDQAIKNRARQLTSLLQKVIPPALRLELEE